MSNKKAARQGGHESIVRYDTANVSDGAVGVNGKQYKHIIFIPDVLDEQNLTAHEFRVVCHIARCGNCFQAIDTMASACRLEAKTVRKCLKKLLRLCMISKFERNGDTTIYRVRGIEHWRPNPLPPPKGTRGGLPKGTSPPLPKGTRLNTSLLSTSLLNKPVSRSANGDGTPVEEISRKDAMSLAEAMGGLPEDGEKLWLQNERRGWLDAQRRPIVHRRSWLANGIECVIACRAGET